MMKRHTAILCLLLCCLTLLQVAGGAVVFGVVPAETSAGIFLKEKLRVF